MRAGELVGPDLLQRIDLRRALDPVELHVLAPDHAPVKQAWVDRESVHGVYSEARCRLPHEPVRIRASGFRTTEVALHAGVQGIVLEPGLPVRLELTEPPGLERDWFLGATPIEDGKLLPGRYLEFDEGGFIEYGFPAPGRYELTWSLRHEGGRYRRLARVEEATKEIEVRDVRDLQEFEGRMGLPLEILVVLVGVPMIVYVWPL